MLKDITANLMVKSVNKTIDFYKKLGFETISTVPEQGVFNWAMVKRDNVKLMFQSRKNLIEELPMLAERPIVGGLTFYILVEDVKEFKASLPSDIRIVKDLYTTLYGAKEIVIQDCNGYILYFAENKNSLTLDS
jgi:hypothetical protein